MSIRNGDKSRYHVNRKKRISLRERTHTLLAGGTVAAGTKAATAGKASPGEPPAKPKPS